MRPLALGALAVAAVAERASCSSLQMCSSSTAQFKPLVEQEATLLSERELEQAAAQVAAAVRSF